MDKESEPIYVYIEELATFEYVNYNQLAPEPNAKPWALPYRIQNYKEIKKREKMFMASIYNGGNKKNSSNFNNETQANIAEENNNCSNCLDSNLDIVDMEENDECSVELVPFVTNNNTDIVVCSESNYSVCQSVIYVPEKSVDPIGRDLPRDTNVLQYFYNKGIDFYNYQLNCFPMYQTINDSTTFFSHFNDNLNNSHTYFSQFTTETNCLLRNTQLFNTFDESLFNGIFIEPSIPAVPCQYMYSPYLGSVAYTMPYVVPQNSPTTPGNYPTYDLPNQFIFPNVYSQEINK